MKQESNTLFFPNDMTRWLFFNRYGDLIGPEALQLPEYLVHIHKFCCDELIYTQRWREKNEARFLEEICQIFKNYSASESRNLRLTSRMHGVIADWIDITAANYVPAIYARQMFREWLSFNIIQSELSKEKSVDFIKAAYTTLLAPFLDSEGGLSDAAFDAIFAGALATRPASK